MPYTANKKISGLDPASAVSDGHELPISQAGTTNRASMTQIQANIFGSKTAKTTVDGTEVVVVRQTDNSLRQVALDNIVKPLLITNAMVSNTAAIADSKLDTINTAGKVTNNAVQAVSTNTANRIVTRDGSGNFAAGTITATLSGNATTATTATTANQTDNTLTRGSYLTGNNFNGSAATTWAVDATATNTANKVVARDVSGNFAAGTITATLTGNVTGNITGSSGSCTGNSATATTLQTGRTISLTGDVTGTTGSFNGSANVSAATTIANNAVTTAKIADANVTTAKIADANVTTAKLATVTQQALLPAGAVMPFAMNSAPAGWLAADGTAVSRTTYSTLFAAIGTTHGAGNGSTTFNLPDLRGIFVRGSGSQTISGSTYSGTFAAKQNDLLKDHTHTYIRPTVATDGSNLKNINGGSLATFSTGGVETGGGAETRPANIALLYCIKF